MFEAIQKKVTLEAAEAFLFVSIFLIAFFTFIFISIPDSLHDSVSHLMLIFCSKCALELGFFKHEYVEGVKALLFDLLFPSLVFCSLVKIDRSELLSIAHFALIALYLNVAVFICGRLGCFAMIRANVLNLAQATACGFGMGSLSAGSTALPFAPTISDHAQNQIIILDMGNKIWELVIVCILVNIQLSEGDIPLKSMFLRIVKKPILIAFVFGVVLTFCDQNMDNLKLTGEFLLDLKGVCGTMIMIFIGLKLQFPKPGTMEVLFPIFIRRGFSFIFISAFQLFVNYDDKTFLALLVFANAANSIWPYVHIAAAVDEPDRRVDSDSLMNLVAYDYALAVFVNSALSSYHEHISAWLTMIIGVGILILTFGTAFGFTRAPPHSKRSMLPSDPQDISVQ